MSGRWLLSAIWSAVNSGRRFLHTSKILPTHRLPCRVVSVGNLQVGGTGKTPVVAFLAAEAVRRGLQVCILTRGYRSEWEKKGGVLEPFQKRPPVSVCGDEPALIHQNVPEAWIGIGARRLRQFEMICQRMGRAPDLVLLDDGFQKVQLHRDVDIVLLSSHTPRDVFFREFKMAAAHAQLRVWSKGFVRPSGINVRIRLEIPPNPKPETGFFLVTSLADPDELLVSLKTYGYRVEREWRLADHEMPSRERYEEQLNHAESRGLTLLMTGKDHVKFQDLFPERSQPWIVEPEVRILEGAEVWNRHLWG